MNYKQIYLIGFTLNIFFILLPSYDTSNLFSWISLGLSFNNNAPTFSNDTNPAGFFTTIFLLPISILYSYFPNMYFISILLKSINFTFLLGIVILSKNYMKTYGVDEKIILRTMSLLLIFPSMLFINYIWVEVDIVPAFFLFCSFYIFRIRPINEKVLNDVVGVISLMISIFFFLYALILIPMFIIYTPAIKRKFELLTLSSLMGILFLITSIIFFQGHLYNYIGSLSGTNISLSPSGLETGFFSYFTFTPFEKIIIEILSILIVSTFLPIYMNAVKFPEISVAYTIILLFLYFSPTINLDNFLFLFPFGILETSMLSWKIHISKENIPNFLPIFVFLIPFVFSFFVYQHQNVWGIFYWFYPFLRSNGFILTHPIVSNIIIPLYNYIFSFSVLLTLFLILFINKNNREQYVKYMPSLYIKSKKFVLKKNTFLAIFIFLTLIAVPLGYSYNDYNNNVNINNVNEFPLLYFLPEKQINTSSPPFLPIGSQSYMIDGANLCIPSNVRSLHLIRNLSGENFTLNEKVSVQSVDQNNSAAMLTQSDVLLSTNNEQIVKLYQLNKGSISALIPSSGFIKYNINSNIPYISSKLNYSEFNLSSQPINYNLNYSSNYNKSFIFFFNIEKIGVIQSLPLSVSFSNSSSRMEIALYKSYGCIAEYNLSSGWSNYNPIYYKNNEVGNWNIAYVKIQNGSITINFDGTHGSIKIPKSSNIKISLGNPISNLRYSLKGYISKLYEYDSKTPIKSNFYIMASNTLSAISSQSTLNSNFSVLNISFNSNEKNSILAIGNSTFIFPPSKFIAVGKSGSLDKIKIQVVKLSIHSTKPNSYFMVPVFFSFYFPFLFIFLFLILDVAKLE